MSAPSTYEQIQAAYRDMAEHARYRPAAPSDGFGNIAVPDDQLDLDREAEQYAQRWTREEDTGDFDIGSCDYTTRRASIFAIEAARLLAGGAGNEAHARKLLEMAAAELPAGE